MNNTLRIVFALCQLLLATVLHAQVGHLRGSVKTSDRLPAEYVTIKLNGLTKGTISDSKGFYELRNLPVGSYTLVVSSVGLETKEQAVEIRTNELTLVPEIVLAENAQLLHDVVVRANAKKYTQDKASESMRVLTPLLELSQNVQIVTKDALIDQQVISMSDGLVRNTSGAARVEHWGDLYTNIVSRGSQLQAFRNGFNVVNSAWGPLTEDMSFVDRIEFVKGPAGFMLANGDPSGLYNVVTKKPSGVTKGEASLTLGSFDLYRTTLDLDGKLSKDGRLLYRLNVSAQNKKSHRAYEHNNRYVIAPVLAYRLSEKTKLTVEYTYQMANMSNVGSYYVFSKSGFATLPRNFTFLSPGLPDTHIHDHSFFVNLEHHFNDKWSITGQVSHFSYQQEGSSMWPSSVGADGNMLRGVSSWEAQSRMTLGQISLNGDLTTGPVRHRVLIGLDMANKAYLADWSQSHTLDNASTPFNVFQPNYGTPANGFPNFDFSSPLAQRAHAAGGLMDQRYEAIYLQDELGFLENRLRLTLAGRYTFVSESQWGGAPKTAEQFTPRIGISGSITEDFSVYALYDQAFIPQNGKLANGNKVQAITGENTELGLKKNWMQGRWTSTMAFYRIVKNNELTADPNSPPTSGLSVVFGQKTAKGVEFDVRGQLSSNFNVIANYAYTDSRVSKVNEDVTTYKVGDIVPQFAKHTANAWINYKANSGLLKGTGASLGFSYLAGRQMYWDASPDPNQILPDYFKLDAGLFWENNSFRVAANVFNLLDEYIYTGSYYKWLDAYYWQSEPGRNFRLSVNYKF